MLPENFRRPYLATDLRDFWRRWHISLSTFLRDYLYIPLGGSRAGPWRYVMATMLTMGLCGLWHGAGWTFVVWGLWHGVGLVACRGWQQLGRPMPALLGWALTMLFVAVGWVVFRATTFGSAASIVIRWRASMDSAARCSKPRLMVVAALAAALIPSAYEIKDRLTAPHPALAAGAAAARRLLRARSGEGRARQLHLFPVLAGAMARRMDRSKSDRCAPALEIASSTLFVGLSSATTAALYAFILLIDPYDVVPFSLPIDRPHRQHQPALHVSTDRAQPAFRLAR